MLELNLIQNTNSNLTANGYNPVGKFYARVEVKETIGVKALAKHMHNHNTVYSTGVIVGVLTDMVECIKELVLEGNVIKIDDLGLFKASVEANGLTLKQGAKVSAGQGNQRTDAELQANPSAQQFAVGAVKLIMQATGETTKDDMSGDAKLTFTKHAKELIKSKTGSDVEGDDSSTGSEQGGTTGSGTTNNGGSTGGENTGGGGTGTITPSGGGDNGGGNNNGDPDPDDPNSD